MLSKSMLNVFVRVVKRKIALEGKTAEEVLQAYPALTEEEKEQILGAITNGQRQDRTR